MVVQLLEQQKDMVIDKKITDVKANSQSVRIETEDGHAILIGLVKGVDFVPSGKVDHALVAFKAVLSHQVAVPGKKEES